MKVALVTGGGSGIGRAAAIALAREDYEVVIAGRKLNNLEETAKIGADAGLRITAVATDIRDPAAVEALFSVVKERFGRLDLLFNNAGTSARAIPMEELSAEQWNRVIETNLTRWRS